MDNGWIKLHRKMLDNPVVFKDADHLAVWIYMLLSATHTEIQAVFGGDVITLQNGQFISGRKAISTAAKVEENKVYRVLKFFEKQQLIEQRTSTKNTLFTIKKWDEYQQSEQQTAQQVNNNCTTSEHKQECKNVRMKEIDIESRAKSTRFVPPSYEDVDAYIKEMRYTVDASKFINFYEAKGWLVGKSKMKDWKAAVRSWQSREKDSYANKRITESARPETPRKIRSVPKLED